MQTSNHTYRVLPYYFERGEYTPTYSMLLFRVPGKHDDVRAIKVRNDIVIDKLWQPAVQQLLPEIMLKTDGRKIFAFDVKNDGELEPEPSGYLGIFDGKVVGIREVDPRLLLPPKDYYEPEEVVFQWLEGRKSEYVLVDYEEKELLDAIHVGLAQHAEFWKHTHEE